MLSDAEKQQIAEVFATVLDARMKELYSEIAAGFVTIVDCMMNDLAGIMENETEQTRRALLEGRDRRTQAWLDKVLTQR